MARRTNTEDRKKVLALVASLAIGVGWDLLNLSGQFLGSLLLGIGLVAGWFYFRDLPWAKRVFPWITTMRYGRIIPYTVVPLAIFSIFAIRAYSQFERAREITDPEDRRNKYVCEVPIPNPLDDKGRFAVLFEFGITAVESEGAFVYVETNAPWVYSDEWFGLPGRTDSQFHKPRAGKASPKIGVAPDGEPIQRRRLSSPSLTPRQSYYLYFESDEPIHAEAIGFLAVSNNSLLPPNRLNRLAASYSSCPH